MMSEESESLRDGEPRPEPLSYAGSPPAEESAPPKPPQSLWRWAARFTIFGLLTLPFTFFGANWFLLVGLLLGSLAAAPAVLFIWAAAIRNADKRLEARSRLAALPLWGVFAASVLLLSCQILSVHRIYSHKMQLVYSTGLAPLQLRSLGDYIEGYHDEHGEIPKTLEALVQDDYVLRRHLVWVDDWPRWSQLRDTGPILCSYAYYPGLFPKVREPKVVMAFEKEPWTIPEYRLFWVFERSVLFGDGTVRCLHEAEFAAALAEDRRRREELHWPVFEWDQALQESRPIDD